MKKVLISLLFFLFYFNLFSSSRIDSLETILEKASSKRRPEILNELSLECRDISQDKSIEYGQLAFKEARERKDHRQEAIALNNIGNAYKISKEYETALVYYLQALSIDEKYKDEEHLTKTLSKLGYIYVYLEENNKAIPYFQRALQISEKNKNINDIAYFSNCLGMTHWYLNNYALALKFYKRSTEFFKKDNNLITASVALNNTGNVYMRIGDYENALRYYLQSLPIKEELGDKKQIANLLNNIGNTYHKLKQSDKAIDILIQAADIYKEIEDMNGYTQTLNNIGVFYNLENEYEAALEYHMQTLEIRKRLNDKKGISISMNNIGNVYRNLENYKKSLEYHLDALIIKKETKDKFSIASSEANIGHVYQLQGDLQKSEYYLKHALKLAKEIESDDLLKEIYINLYELYLNRKNYQEALSYHRLHSKLKDKMYNEESSKRIAEMQVKYETGEKEQEIELLNSEKKLRELKISQQNIIIYSSILAILITVILIMLISHQSRLRKKEIEERKRIEKEIKELNRTLEKRVKEELDKHKKQQQLLIQKSKLESLGKLAAGIAHEINQPLGGISMSLDNILQKMNSNQLDNKYLNKKFDSLFEHIERIRRIIEHIRIFSRDQQSVIFEKIDVNQTIRDAVSMVQTQYRNHNIDLSLELEETAGFTLGNKFKLEQVVLNLLNNAKDAVEEKASVKLDYDKKINLKTYSKRKKVFIEIKDNGTGISKENLEKIFDPFFTTKDADKSTGLGLSIIYGILTEMKGDIIAESEQDEYTVMKVVLPESFEKESK